MKPTKKKRVRKPKDTELGGRLYMNEYLDLIEVGDVLHTAKDARKLAAWLIKAASYLEQKEAK